MSFLPALFTLFFSPFFTIFSYQVNFPLLLSNLHLLLPFFCFHLFLQIFYKFPCFSHSQKSLEEEAQRLLNLISTVSSDIHRLPRENLDDMLETLNVSFHAQNLFQKLIGVDFLGLVEETRML